jgi:mono/diheme cytochrome c family protein
MMGAGMFPPFAADAIDLISPSSAAVTPGVTVEYGQYLARTCEDCHADRLNGKLFGPPGQEYLSPNLTPGGELSGWTEKDFITTIRSGVTPTRKPLNQDMPWKYYSQMTDDELKAIWLYLQSLPALDQGK